MQKTTFKFKLNSILLFLFLIHSFVISAQDKSVEIAQQFNNYQNKSNIISKSHQISYRNTSPFVMLSGYTKDISNSDIIYYRLKINNTFGNWIAFKNNHEGETTDRRALAPVYIEQAFDDIQFKTEDNTNSNFVFRLFMPEFSKNQNNNRTARNASTTKALSGCTQPAFQGRLDWCPGGTCPKSNNPSTTNPTHVVIHHSASDTSSSDFAAVVRGYWDYHVNTNGWADIGYNWLIDPNGVVYEGRGDRVQGAHSPCMNSISSGICFIGNFETGSPSSSGLQTLKDFIAWEVTDKNIDVTASSTAGSLGVMANVSGHKDGKLQYPSSNCTSTLCPGANLYSQISNIKSSVAAYSCYISSANAPSTPLSFAAISSSNTSVDIHITPVTSATSYGVYKSTDNITFSKVTESASTTIPITSLTQGQVYYFKVEAINNDGSSDLSRVLAAIPSQSVSNFLIVDGVERRTIDAIAQYDYPMTQLGHTFSSATNDAVINGLVNMGDFKFVIWMLLDESTVDSTFNSTEQTKVTNFINSDGIFIVSGDEIGWDLVEKGNAADQTFYANVLRANYIADEPSFENYKVKSSDNVLYNLDNGSNGFLLIDYPDVIKPLNGSSFSFSYDGVSSTEGYAGVSYQSANGGVEYMGFALEAVYNDTQRKNLLNFIFDKYSAYLNVDDGFIKQNFKLYPNPTTGVISISNHLKLNSVTIYNAYGQLLKNQISNTIDLSNLSNGVYFINIKDETGKHGTYKVIKIK